MCPGCAGLGEGGGGRREGRGRERGEGRRGAGSAAPCRGAAPGQAGALPARAPSPAALGVPGPLPRGLAAAAARARGRQRRQTKAGAAGQPCGHGARRSHSSRCVRAASARPGARGTGWARAAVAHLEWPRRERATKGHGRVSLADPNNESELSAQPRQRLAR